MGAHPTKAPPLGEVQQWLRKVFTGAPGSHVPDLSEVIVDQPPISRAERLAIYTNAFFWRLLESMSEDFEATGKSITHLKDYDKFSDLVREFVRAHPSHSANITDLGGPFPEFVAAHSLAREFPWLGELARLERAYTESFLAPGPTPLPAEQLALLSGESGADVRLAVGGSVRVFRSEWPVLGLWRKRKGACRLPFPKKPKAQSLLLRRRPSGTVVVDLLDPTAALLLGALADGKTLGEACGFVEAKIKDPAVISVWFQSWMADGIFSQISL